MHFSRRHGRDVAVNTSVRYRNSTGQSRRFGSAYDPWPIPSPGVRLFQQVLRRSCVAEKPGMACNVRFVYVPSARTNKNTSNSDC